MIGRILSTTAATLLLGTVAFAQNQPADVNMPSSNWENSVNETFFSDTTNWTLRSSDEIRTGFGGLSADQQASVRDECAKPEYAQNSQIKQMENSGSSSGGGGTTGTDTTTTSSTSGTAGTDGKSDVKTAMASLCETINGLQ